MFVHAEPGPAQLLLTHGADPSQPDNQGYFPLMLVVSWTLLCKLFWLVGEVVDSGVGWNGKPN